MPTREFLDPNRKLVDAVVDWLCAKAVRDAAGAMSLAHLMAVVPTAQSGRNLRLALARQAAARGWGGVLPPQIVQPMQIIRAQDESLRTATTLQLRAAFLKFVASRPRRRMEQGRVVLEEWQSLFRSAYITDVKSHLAFFDQLADIWRILAGGGLLMAEVDSHEKAQELLAAAVGDEQARWRELGEFETAFFGFLHAHGLRHEVEAIHLAKTAAQAISPEIQEVVLPALADPVSVVYDVLNQQRPELKVTVLLHADAAEADRFDVWGRPTVAGWTGARAPALDGIRTEDVIRTGTDTELAKRLAADFPPATEDAELPSLGLCDEELYPELAAAFLNAGYELHNPERYPLSASSLGHLVDGLITLYAERKTGAPWDVFASLLRQDDVLCPVLDACGKDEGGNRITRTEVLAGLDVCRNAFLPHCLPSDLAFDESRLKSFDMRRFHAFQTAARAFLGMVNEAQGGVSSVAGFVRNMLQRIYAQRTLPSDAKEFRAAAELVRQILGELESEQVVGLGLAEGALVGLLRKTVSEASYSLDPDSKSAVKTEGWLELAWSPASKIALAGFREGAVPDAVVGHAFLPDALREALELTSNRRRLARDSFLLTDLLRARSREPGSVRAYVSQTNNAGDLHRPSRLLFLVAPDSLALRARGLFGDLPPSAPSPARVLVDAWRPQLPAEVAIYGKKAEFPDGRLSASAIDAWLKCPFSYLFSYGLGMRRVEERTELEADDFGTVVHRVLELYAREQLARTQRGLAQLHEVADIESSLARAMDAVRRSYGAQPSVKLRLQLDAAADRLRCFARIQAKWAAEGWVVKEKPEYDFVTRPFAGEGDCDVSIKGSVDRIDWKEGEGYRLIDYKTWDRRQGAAGRILKGGLDQAQHAARLKLPVLGAGEEEKKRKRFLTVQLPLYGRCLEKYAPELFAGKIVDYCYVLLGSTPEDSVVLGSAFDQKPFEAAKTGKMPLAEHVELALETARVAIRRIRGNFFWPPGPSEEWRWDVKDLLSVSPDKDFPVGTAWRDAQEAKLAQLAAEGGAA